MSRIVVKNLPRTITADQLKVKFSEKGTVTDVQLKYTDQGKFRRFAFIGYHRDDQALAAIDYFNNTFVFSSKIKIELCSNLGDVNKPKSWSKYAPDSSAYQEIQNKGKNENEQLEQNADFTKIKNKKNIDPALQELYEKYKDDPKFSEFLEIHGKDFSNLKKSDDFNPDSGIEEEEEKRNVLANAAISDMEYLKFLKTKSSSNLETNIDTKFVPNYKRQFYTIVIKNLPAGTKKKDIKAFFKPIPLASVRVPRTFIGMAYVGFKEEKHFNKGLNKNKSFWKGKQLNIYKYNQEKNTNETEHTEDNFINNAKAKHWKTQEESLQMAEGIAESGRIFVRNLSYTVTEDDLQKLFEKHGPLTEVILPIDKESGKTKGFALITYLMPEHAALAYQNLDGTSFLGRMLHLIPGKAKEKYGDDTQWNEGSSFKNQKAKELKKIAGHVHTWNTLFLGTNAIAEAMAETYNATKEEVFSGSGAATRLAMGETEIVEKTRTFLEENGVELDAFNQVVETRSKNTIIVKNLPYKTQPTELKTLFENFGDIGRILIPPYGITGIVEFLHKSEAKAAFNKLAYSKFKETPLYLEWAPVNIFKDKKIKKKKEKTEEEEDGNENKDNNEEEGEGEEDEVEEEKNDEEEGEDEEVPEPDTTLYIKNLSFDSDEDSVRKHFKKCGSIANITVARKKDPKNPGQLLSMGYGFIQFYTQDSLNKALKDLQNTDLDGHQVELKRSNKNLETETTMKRKKNNVAKQTGSKILVRNIPFQAKQSEVEELFKAFGEIKFVRLPKKMVGSGSHRGFGFVEYISKKDAKRAMKSLCQSTHLYGRRLVLEWAEETDNIEEIRKRSNKYFGADESSSKKNRRGVADIDVDRYDVETMEDN